MTRSSSEQARLRRECFKQHKKTDICGDIYMMCHICGGKIFCAIDGWEASHTIAHAFDGKEVLPAHIKCHRKQTSEVDVPAIAKSKRISEKHLGIKRKGWNTKFKKKLSGETVPR